MSGSRLATGGSRIDRSRPVRFTFDDRPIEGFAGDTIASALLAADVAIVGRGIYTGRPRGVLSAGPEEPNALVQVVRPDGISEPMLRATTVEIEDGLVVRSLAGRGALEPPAGGPDTRRFDHRYRHVEVLVIGGGAAGRAAAAAAVAEAPGNRVLLVDDGPAVEPIPGVDALARTTATGIHDHRFVVLVQRRPDPRTEGRLWHVRAGRIVIATGAIERPLVFADNDRPGIMLASAAATYVERYGVLPGRRVVAASALAFGAARPLESVGAEVVAWLDGESIDSTSADAGARLSAVIASGRTIESDLLVVSGGWSPNAALWTQAGGRLAFDDLLGSFVPVGTGEGGEVVGAASGKGLPRAASFVSLPREGQVGSTHFVDFERDATYADLARAAGTGMRSIEHLKRYTTIGTGSDQGRTSGVLASTIAAALLGQEPGALGLPTYRPPYVPMLFAQVAGRDRGALSDPVRTTAIHAWHVAHGAVFEDVGQWKRPRFFPRGDESMDDAVLRECTAARAAVAVMDASTLGKIDLQGPDAGIFLDRVYTNGFARLKVGSCRYGLMCRVDGMVFDDGVTSRLADDRFHMTTTTGNAAAVLDHLEEWLQTEWPELRVRATSVTEQWATVAVVGPRSRDVLAALAPDLDVSVGGFPFMAWRDATVAGIAARVFRISFSGELAYEINVPAWHGSAVWEAVMAAGARFGITPYGTEAMHVLRAEKGYPIIGQETDGTVTPQDLGMDWIVSKTKPFLGSRSHRRAENLRPDRKQLVAVLPVDPTALIPEGNQLVAAGTDLAHIPVPMIGHVTSSYRSAALGRTFGLALVRGGRARLGETVVAPLADGTTIEATIADSVVFDPDNLRRDGAPEPVA
jgi:sarcosine oxidase subunit alpha